MMLSKTMATEFIPKNIRVNSHQPRPDPHAGLGEDREAALRRRPGEDYLQSVADEHAAIKRFGTVEELADFFVFLCSERASYSVGSTYFVDGGMLRTI